LGADEIIGADVRGEAEDCQDTCTGGEAGIGVPHTRRMQKLAAVILLTFVSLHAPADTDESRAKRTMDDMRAVVNAIDAYATDNNRFPDGKSVADVRALISPTYIKNAPEKDAWGTPFAYRVDATHQGCRFISAGPDRKFDPTSLDITQKPAASDDIVYQDDDFIQAPPTSD